MPRPEGSKNVHELTIIFLYSIVAVHGPNGHRENTFTASNGICWLSSLLPALVPNIRVLSYGYDARTHSSSFLSRENLHDHAEQLIEALRRLRTITEVKTHKGLEGNSIRPEAFGLGHQSPNSRPVTGLHFMAPGGSVYRPGPWCLRPRAVHGE